MPDSVSDPAPTEVPFEEIEIGREKTPPLVGVKVYGIEQFPFGRIAPSVLPDEQLAAPAENGTVAAPIVTGKDAIPPELVMVTEEAPEDAPKFSDPNEMAVGEKANLGCSTVSENVGLLTVVPF